MRPSPNKAVEATEYRRLSLFRKEIASTLRDEDDVEKEMNALLEAIGR